MMRSLWTAASGMRAQQVNVDTIANNVANINTIGYKSQQASFKSLLYQNLQSTSTNNAGENKPVAAEVGLGSRVAAITSTFTQGNLTHVENPFSVALEGDGFFQIRTESGELQYTRDGTGNPAVITDANGRPVKFGIYQFNNPAGLSKEGSNNYSVTVASGAAVAENGNAAVKQTKTHQYYTEASNVDVANEMVNLIVAQRAYEMNSKAIQASDEMMQQANALR